MSGDRNAVRLRISGSVQGVGYRYWLEHEATRLGLTGTVRNRVDGTVEAICVGTPDELAALRDACRRGPPGAHVDSVASQALDADETAAAFAAVGFTRRPTG